MSSKAPQCPMEALLNLLSGPWTLYIVWNLMETGPMRFGALRRAVAGISTRVLTERLRRLENAGVIYRDHKPTIPPEVTYGITARGMELQRVLGGLSTLAARWQVGAEPATSAPLATADSSAVSPT
ncbi:MAG: helix-turn-helix domain-containing protein [Proteobacteria bacterium]|nr:helix-turn-helix domain-containing protein [Pseudomonadota bacterium]MDA1059835.1 helix-turn-helix domain-containing protein [Pseudomonadota bacterium]